MIGPPNIQMQKTGARFACQPVKCQLASDLERSKDREEKAESPGCKRGLEGVGRSC
jgi:hypothetical protein